MDINCLAEILNEVVKRLDQTQNEKNKLDQVMERLDTLQIYIDEVKEKLERLDQKTDFIYQTQLVETHDKISSEVEIKDGRKLQGEIEQVKTSITSLDGHFDTLEKSITTVVQKIDSVETSLNNGHKTVKENLEKIMATVVLKIDSVETFLNDGHKTVKENLEKSVATVVQKIDSVKTFLNDGHKTVKQDLLSLKQGQDLVTKKIEQSTNEVKENLYRSKREIFAVTEKEAQIVRDRIEGPLPSLGNYSFDFYVENFKTFFRSEKGVDSPPWHINEEKTSRAGFVWFQADGNIQVRFINGRHPREVGLQPRPARKLKVKATICDVYKKVLPDFFLGEITGNLDETVISSNSGWGWSLGVTSCDDLINKGYGQKEGYHRGAILIRYDVTVL